MSIRIQNTNSYSRDYTKRSSLAHLSIIILLSYSSGVYANFIGKVTRIIDGDTLEVLYKKKSVRIRLMDMDAPEIDQAYGNQAQMALSQRILDRDVLVESGSEDRYGRHLAYVYLGKRNINQEMVKIGYAWAYRDKTLPTFEKMIQLEKAARRKKVGLWKERRPIPPWVFRDRDRE